MRNIYLTLLVILLAGCASTSPPTQFYVLAGGAPTTQGSTVTLPPEVAIGIGPVKIPAMLDRPQIVTRSENHRVNVADFHRWAGELSGNMMRVIAGRVLQQLGTDQVFMHPWPGRQKVDYQVRVDVFQFDGVLGKEVVLKGTYTLLNRARQSSTRSFEIVGPVTGSSYSDLVVAMGGLVTELSDQIIQEIRNH